MNTSQKLFSLLFFFLLISFTQISSKTISRIFQLDTTELKNHDTLSKQKWIHPIRDSLISYSKNQNRTVNMVWEDRGPDNFGGRTRAVCIDRNNNNHVFCGSVAGGLFESWNGGVTWNVVSGFYEYLRISTMTQTLDGTYYVGTGSSFDIWNGNGIWSSSDNGATWTLVPGSAGWTIVNEISADGGIPDKIWIAGSNTAGGFQSYTSSLGFVVAPSMSGSSWQDCKVSPDGQVIVACKAGLSAYVSTDGGLTFNSITGPINSNLIPSTGARMEFGMSFEKNSNNKWTVFASTAMNELRGVFISESNGEPNTWYEIAQSNTVQTSFTPFNSSAGGSGQGVYDHIISGVPGNPDHCLLGGVEMYKWKKTSSNPIAGTWTQQTTWDENSSTITYAHTEIHELKWDSNGVLYMGGDGGVYKSFDLGEDSWVEHNQGLNIALLYSVAFNKYNHVMGGSQGNGTLVNDYSFPSTGLAFQKLPTSGEGFDCDFSQMSPHVFFYTRQNGGIFRCDSLAASQSIIQTLSASGGSYATPLRLHENLNDLNSEDSIQFVANQNYLIGDTIILQSPNQNYEFNYIVNSVINIGDTIMIQDPIQSLLAIGNNSNVVLTRGALRNNLSLQWSTIVTNVGSVRCIEFSSDGNYMYVGGTTGLAVVKGLNTFYSPANDISGVTVTSISGFGSISGVGVDPNDPDHIVVAAGNTLRECNNATTATGLGSFPAITGLFTSMPIYDAIIDYLNPNKIVIGTEFGIYATDDGGNTWTYQNGPGFVPVYEIRQQWRTDSWNAGVVYAGTFGRGIWSSNSFVGIQEQDFTSVVNSFITDIRTFPNPLNNTGTISFELKDRGNVDIYIMDLNGKVVMNKNMGTLNSGKNMATIDVTNLAAGSYIVSIVSGENIGKDKLIVTH